MLYHTDTYFHRFITYAFTKFNDFRWAAREYMDAVLINTTNIHHDQVPTQDEILTTQEVVPWAEVAVDPQRRSLRFVVLIQNCAYFFSLKGKLCADTRQKCTT